MAYVRRIQRFLDAPTGWDYYGQKNLYVVEFSNGIVKIGITARPRDRMVQLDRQHSEAGVAIRRFHVAQAIDERGCFMVERDVIRRLTRIANPCRNAFEYFSHIGFGTAKTLLRQIAKRASVVKAI